MGGKDIIKISSENPVVFFDGVCAFCTWAVRFVLKRDKKKKFRFCPLQSEQAQFIAKQVTVNDNYETVVVLYRGQMYQKSDVTFFILNELGGSWRLFLIFKVIPKFLRDAVYDLVARYRYSIFGKRQHCYLPTSEERYQFL